MKNSIKIISSVFIFVAVLFSLNSCKKDKTPPPVETTAMFYLHIHTAIDTTEADTGMVCADATGRHFEMNLAQLYISNVVLHKPDGSTYAIAGSYILKTIAIEPYALGQVPAGNYSYVSFDVGIDAAKNASDPSTNTGCLAIQNPSMWFGSTAQGFMFANVQGKADTTIAQLGPVDSPFSYQLGTNSMLRSVTLPLNPFTVVGGQDQVVHVIADYGVLLQGINFKTQSNATPFVNATVATQIANNIPLMFHFE
ncbi:MAG: hypothetical protein NT084_03350 [Bacteroidetes bacterium]|jgi:hypothetical protein|nr:hypothetical protein [Bacteroidota bacterium]